MTPVPWEKVARFIEEAHKFRGRVERADALDLAFMEKAPDEVVDAIDALGSRIFPTPQAARDFLVAQKYVAA